MGVSGDVSAEKAESRQQTYIFHICLVARQTREWQTALLALVGRGATPREGSSRGRRSRSRKAGRHAGRHGGRQAGRVSGVVGSYDAVEPI